MTVTAHVDTAPRFFNRTRRVRSIPRRLLADWKPHLIPLYYALLASDLAREAVAGSGSYRFADHLYRREPSGRWVLGKALDWLLLQLPSSRSFRTRYLHARNAIVDYVSGHPADERPRVLSVPCGIAREMVDAARALRATTPERYADMDWVGVDLDPIPLQLTEQLVDDQSLSAFQLHCRDAFDSRGLPPGQSLITSTGFGEFLSDDELRDFYSRCHAALRQDGWFVTSAMRRHVLSDYLLRTLADLHVHYREPDEIRAALADAGFRRVVTIMDRHRLQTLVVAVR